MNLTTCTTSEVVAVGERFNAVPFDVRNVFWSHHSKLCTFSETIKGNRDHGAPRLRARMHHPPMRPVIGLNCRVFGIMGRNLRCVPTVGPGRRPWRRSHDLLHP